MEHNENSESALIVPPFAPVPRLKDRSNGWKPHIQQQFIAALAETGSVAAACRRIGRDDQGAYRLRRHPEAESFRAAWDAALELGVRRIEDGAMDRALYGTEEIVIQNGETVLKRRRYNERLVMFILRNRAPERFTTGGARGMSALDRSEIARLKKEWRAQFRREWDAERRREDEAENDGDTLTEMLETMHRNWFTSLSPATRAAYAEFRRQERADRAHPLDWLKRSNIDPDAEQTVIDAQYEEHFGPGKDHRPGIWKVIDVEALGAADLADGEGGERTSAADPAADAPERNPGDGPGKSDGDSDSDQGAPQ